MRILIVSNLYPPKVLGGYEIACAKVADALVARGHDVTVLTSTTEVPHADDPPWVRRHLVTHWFHPIGTRDGPLTEWRIHRASCADFGNSAQLIATLRSFRPDLCYVWNPLGVAGGALLGAINASRVPWTLHLMDNVPEPIANNMPPHVLSVFGGRLSDLFAPATVISMSEHLLDEIAESVGLRFVEPVEIIPGWFDRPCSRPHLPYMRDGVARFVAAGTLQSHKGVELIIAAAGRLNREGVRLKVDFYGGGDVGPLVALANASGAGAVVAIHGPRSQAELFDIYAESDAFLFPTWEREPFGFAPVEAAGCGTPPIMTQQCGAAERLVGDVHCIKIDRDIDALAEAMRRVARGEVDLARMGRAGAAVVRQDMSFARCMDRIEAVLARCARKPWDRRAVDDPRLEQLAYLQDMLALQMRFG